MIGVVAEETTRVSAERGSDRRGGPAAPGRGTTLAVVVASVIVVAALVPATRDLFVDDRAGGAGIAGLLYQAVVRIPLGTAVFEEVAFRGVLLALFLRTMSPLRAVSWSSVLFGLWHVVPAWESLGGNDAAAGVTADGFGRAVGILGAVVATTIAGYLFCWLRLRADSLVSPLVAHVSTNSLAFTAAYFVVGSQA